jgi:frataxin-like iron-binding protein CyaY
MKLPTASQEYSSNLQQQANFIIEQEDRRNFKKDTDVNINDGRLILKAPNGTRYKVTVDNSGNLGTTAI